MNRYELIRKAVDGLQHASNKASHLTFRSVRAGVDWLEKRDPNAQRSTPVPVGPLNTDEAIDEAVDDSFPASDPPAGWAGPPDP